MRKLDRPLSAIVRGVGDVQAWLLRMARGSKRLRDAGSSALIRPAGTFSR